MRKIKFYSVGDWATGDELIKIEKKLKEVDKSRGDFNINEILEFFNIIKYIENEVYLKSWDSQFINELKGTKKDFKRIIGKFLGSVGDENIIEIYLECYIYYRDNFWELIELYKIHKRISAHSIDILLEKGTINIYDFLKHYKLVETYGDSVRDHLISQISSAKILLNKYVMPTNGSENIYLPKELTEADKELILKNYINSECPHINYLDIITKVRSSKEFNISDRIKLEAKRRLQTLKENLFDRSSSVGFEYCVGCSKNIKEEIEHKYTDSKCEFYYSSKWVEENLDYSTLLNNYIFLFGFVDLNMRINLISKLSEVSTLEKTISINSKESYKLGQVFESKDIISKLQMNSYYNLLKSFDVRLEYIIKWFFEEYLKDEFNIENFVVNMPTENTSYFEKCRFVLPEMEYILKQFSSYVTEGSIDQELLQISSSHLIYSTIPSLLSKKYMYPIGEEFNWVTYYFFSDQCMLSYVEKIDKHYNNFYELLINEEVYTLDYNEIYMKDLNWLVDHNYIKINELGKINIINQNMVLVLKDLYINGFINYKRYFEDLLYVVDEMLAKGMLEIENTLLSRQESDYFNYYLNKSSFDNSLDLRNMYSHGTQPNPDDNFHMENYFIFLRLIILIIIKINDELGVAEIASKQDKT